MAGNQFWEDSNGFFPVAGLLQHVGRDTSEVQPGRPMHFSRGSWPREFSAVPAFGVAIYGRLPGHGVAGSEHRVPSVLGFL